VAIHPGWNLARLTGDLHIGGVIMWVGGDTLMLWPMIPAARAWMHMDERRAARIDRQLDAQMPAQPPRSISSTRTPSGSVQ
jgi:cytochrome c oxidase assembly factor CtaG